MKPFSLSLEWVQGAFGRLGAITCVATAALLFPLFAFAGVQRPCSQPAVFQGAAINSFVLPYRYVGAKPAEEVQAASRELSALVHFEVLFSLLKYGSVGGTDLVATGREPCDVDSVINDVSHGRSPDTLLPGRALIVTWGRLFEQDEQLYLQSYVRFLRRGEEGAKPETVSVKLQAGESSLDLIAALPTQAVAFPPRRISRGDLARVKAEFRRTMIVRSEPNLDAPGRSIDFGPNRVFPYLITETRDGWMKIQPMAEGPAGWVRARVEAGESREEWSLRRWLPELSYIDAIAGFLKLRTDQAGSPEPAIRVRQWVDSGFARFKAAVPEQDAPVAYGLASAVQGFIAFDVDGASGRSEAVRLFGKARELMPDYAASLNLAAVTQPLGAEGPVDAATVDRLGRRLTGALALDPGDAIVLTNLRNVYSLYAAQPAWSPFAPQELSQRVAVVKGMIEKVSPVR